MATTITAATLTVKISEQISLGGVERGGITTLTIASVGEVYKRIVHVESSTNGTSLLTMGSATGIGTVVGADIKYLRVTNLDDTNFVNLQLTDGTQTAIFKLEAGKSFLLGSDRFDDEDDVDNVSFAGLTTITALADTADCDVEIFVATT